MASLRSRLINFSTRLLIGYFCRKALSPQKFRSLMGAVEQRSKGGVAPGVAMREQTGEVNGKWLENAQAEAGKLILYLHGGAFIMRMPHAHSAMLSRICRATQRSAFMPWYRLAPEDPFPAGPEDCLAAYRFLLDSGFRPQDIVVMGDSAGGNLTLALLHLLRREGLPMPEAAVMLSPVLDMAQISASWRLNSRRDPMYCVQTHVNPIDHYLPAGSDLLDPIISPCYGEFQGFPPLLSLVGDIECLLDDSIAMVRKAVEAGVPAEVHIWSGMPHVFTLRTEMPESELAIVRVVQWLEGVQSAASSGSSDRSLYRGCVRVFDRAPIVGRLRERSNEIYHSHAK